MSRLTRHALWLFVPLLSAYTLTNQADAASPAAKNPLTLKFNTPSAARGAQLSAGCAGCHGAKGQSTNPQTPGLAGQIPSYLQLQLTVFRAKLRPSAVMQSAAAKLSDQDIVDLTAYYAAQTPGPAWKADPAARARGAKLYTAGDTARNVIACQICHGASGRGVASNGVASITNLSPGYALSIMHEFHSAAKFSVIEPDAMRIALKPLTDSDLTDVVAYISSMK